jgi:hypothetical protein
MWKTELFIGERGMRIDFIKKNGRVSLRVSGK